MTIVYKLISAQGNPVSTLPPNTAQHTNSVQVPNIRCPHCMHMGAFSVALPNDLAINHRTVKAGAMNATGASTVGIRVCPNVDCKGIVLVVIDASGKVVALPNEILDFDSTDIPPAIAASLEEAIKCHSAQCYKAAALMVRIHVCLQRSATSDALA
jgi:hypothetical protein